MTTRSITAASTVVLSIALLTLSPVYAQEDADAGAAGKDMVGADGMVQYGNPKEMWKAISGNWQDLVSEASGRWGKISEDKLKNTDGEREKLVQTVADGYEIEKADAEREVDTWAQSLKPK